MAISDWPAEQRPRERLISQGAHALSDAELLAIFLRTGIKGKNAIDMSRDLLTNNNGLRGLLSLNREEFCKNKGMGDAKYVQLQATIEMAKRLLHERLKRGDAFTSAEITSNFVKHKLSSYPYEVFACLFLDAQNRLIQFEELFRGSISSANVHTREIVRKALEHNAAATILAHNHPSGVAEPSQSDCQITMLIKQALELIDVKVLDHIVVGDDVISMAQRGMI